MYRSVQNIGPVLLGAAAYLGVFFLYHALFRAVYSPSHYGQPIPLFFRAAIELLNLAVPVACGAVVARFEERRPMLAASISGAVGALVAAFFFSYLGQELAGPNSSPAAADVVVVVLYQAALCAMACGAFRSLRAHVR